MFTETVRQQASDYGMLLLRFLPLLMILTGSQVYGVTSESYWPSSFELKMGLENMREYQEK